MITSTDPKGGVQRRYNSQWQSASTLVLASDTMVPGISLLIPGTRVSGWHTLSQSVNTSLFGRSGAKPSTDSRVIEVMAAGRTVADCGQFVAFDWA
jgi:hypothetical protein